MKAFLPATLMLLVASSALADPLRCNLSQYSAGAGLTAVVDQDVLTVTWAGDGGSELRARYVIDNGTPVVRELAIRKGGGQWNALGQNLVPEFRVTSGVRRMSYQQVQPLRDLGVEITPEIVDREKWFVFWDAPLVVPGVPVPQPGQTAKPPATQPLVLGQPQVGRNIGLPRQAEEIRHAAASYKSSSCDVKTDGARLEVTFPGLSMGIFTGSLRYTMYRGTRMFRMEAIAKTDEPSVAYKYEAGLKGFSTNLTPRVVWRDTGGDPQHYGFGGLGNEKPVPVKARHRILIAEGKAGSLATFTPPHTFFFTREVDTNLGYVWYRKDSDANFGIGIRQGDGEENLQYVENFALYNAPPGTWQRMAVYFLASADQAEPTREAVLAFTRGDRFKPIPGYKTMVNHFHLRFTERQRAAGGFDNTFQDLVAMKALGINIVGLSDFHGDLRQNDTGLGRYQDQKDYATASGKASDKDFLVTPWEEPSAYFGGHYNILFPKNVYWTKRRDAGQPFTENLPGFGKVYHAGSTTDMQQMLDAEDGYWFHAHPRTKGTTGYPDAIFDKAWVRNDRYLGVAFKPGMPQDNSEPRMCEFRCFDTTDTMNNLIANSGLRPKYIIADVDTYKKSPEDDLYPGHPVNYVKLDRVPRPTEDWRPILTALRNGDFWVTTGEILITSYAVEGTGNARTIAANLEWTFPLEFVEVVWGDGKTIDRQIIRVTDLPPYGSKKFAIPFNAAGKSWVRFAAWDSAGNGAFVQPVWLNQKATTTAQGR
jgi:hypothetical protein